MNNANETNDSGKKDTGEVQNNSKRKPGDPLVFIPDGAQLNFDFSPQKPPRTKYNKSVLLMNEQEYQRITGVKNGRDGRDFV